MKKVKEYTMKKILLALILLPSLALAQIQPGEGHIWEKVAFGSVPGASYVRIKGWNPAITTTFEDASPESSALAIPIVALTTPYCASTNQANDIAAGTGANTLSLTIVKTDFTEVTETLTLDATDGRTSAPLATTSVLGFNDVRVATTGSNKGNVGVIDCGDGSNTAGSVQNAYATIPVYSATAIQAAGTGAANVAEVFQYIVPAGYTLICRNIQVGSTFATQASGIAAVIDGSTNLGILRRFWVKMIAQAGAPSVDPGVVVFPEKTYIKGKLAGTTGTNTGPATMSMDCIKLKNSYVTSAQTLF